MQVRPVTPKPKCNSQILKIPTPKVLKHDDKTTPPPGLNPKHPKPEIPKQKSLKQVIDWGLAGSFEQGRMKSNVGTSTYSAPEAAPSMVY